MTSYALLLSYVKHLAVSCAEGWHFSAFHLMVVQCMGAVVARAHRAAEGGERACNYVDGMVLIVTKFRPYPLRVSVYYYVYPQIFRACILFLVIFSISPSMLLYWELHALSPPSVARCTLGNSRFELMVYP